MSDAAKRSEIGPRLDATTRVDTPHVPETSGIAESESLQTMRAIAGKDPHASAEQLRSQAAELALLLRDKQRMLEERESEINARLAVLDNESRVSRLREQFRPAGNGPKRPSPSSADGVAVEDRPPLSHTLQRRLQQLHEQATGRIKKRPAQDILASSGIHASGNGATSDAPTKLTLREALQQIVATADNGADSQSCDTLPPLSDPSQVESGGTTEPMTDHQGAAPHRLCQRPPENVEVADEATVSAELPSGQDSSHAVESGMTSAYNAASIKKHGDRLAQQEEELERRERKAHAHDERLQRMRDEVTELHREALELRLATEQVYAELLEHCTKDEINASLSRMRERLTDHYKMASDSLATRKDELYDLRDQLRGQELRLRKQRRDVQLWIERRQDELELRESQLIARQREIDRLEADLDRQALEWQQQRDAFRQQV